MEYTTLGSTGLRISRVGLGTWQFSEAWGRIPSREEAKAIISKAIELGINFFDTAMTYGLGVSEYLLGYALRESGAKRDEFVVTTKIPGEYLSEHDIPKAVRRSLRNLGLDKVDVLLAHWPPCWSNFPTCSYARAMERLVRLGLVDYLGLSDHPVELIESFRECLAREDVEVIQIKYNVIERQAELELIPYAEANDITVQAWSPIAKGVITGKYKPGDKPQDVRMRDPLFHPDNLKEILRLVKVLESIAAKINKSVVQIALNWLITASPVVIPIPGARDPRQVEELAGSVGWRLSYSDWMEIEEASRAIRITYSINYLKSNFQERLS